MSYRWNWILLSIPCKNGGNRLCDVCIRPPFWRVSKVLHFNKDTVGNRCQIIHVKLKFWKNDELQSLDTTKRILLATLGGRSWSRERANAFLVLHTFLCIFHALHAPMTSEKYKEMYGELKYETTLSTDQLNSSNVGNKLFFVVSNVCNSSFYQNMNLTWIIWYRFPTVSLLKCETLPTRQLAAKTVT